MKRLLLNLFLTIILLVGWGAGIFYLQYQKTLNAPLVAEGDGIVTVKRGDTLATLNRELIRRGIISGSDWVLPLYARLNPQAANIKAGDYRIDENATLPSLINDITNGKVVVYSVTVIEGKTFKDLRETLRQTAGLEHTLNSKTDAEVATLLGLQGNPEGWFLPETYQFNRGTTDLDMLKRMYDEMQRTLEKAWASRAEGLPLATPYEALILASIIEKETGVAAERPQISGVFTRRLQKNMLLQTDPTVIYGAADYHGDLTRKHLQTDTPYNTYINKGLPPTPIALPGKASIEAALHPADGDSLYFVADGTGGHTFSATYEEHQQAVADYLKKQQNKP
ncbi:endolytic transglycosylase MltG [Cardiobacterium valvarum]|uniref:Endolytic murein transglycosylase n=1 Tax=Cardiobacterium valvarum TaxID=194702 RepID=A0A381DX91_9GAMM|nr:endolytic transglycosylase MltG [Cardiobacterium valvarum]SUX17791.1 putative aminodeoxychorismate lyase [Cardiobacterium valvarum]